MTMLPGLRFVLLAAGIAGVVGCATTTNHLANVPEMVTDRPDFTESASVVPRGRVQLEAGYTYARDEDAGVLAAHSYPEALARIGVVDDRLELRLGQSVLTTRSRFGMTRSLNRSAGNCRAKRCPAANTILYFSNSCAGERPPVPVASSPIIFANGSSIWPNAY
jgi:hypothetical protein